MPYVFSPAKSHIASSWTTSPICTGTKYRFIPTVWSCSIPSTGVTYFWQPRASTKLVLPAPHLPKTSTRWVFTYFCKGWDLSCGRISFKSGIIDSGLLLRRLWFRNGFPWRLRDCNCSSSIARLGGTNWILLCSRLSTLSFGNWMRTSGIFLNWLWPSSSRKRFFKDLKEGGRKERELFSKETSCRLDRLSKALGRDCSLFLPRYKWVSLGNLAISGESLEIWLPNMFRWMRCLSSYTTDGTSVKQLKERQSNSSESL